MLARSLYALLPLRAIGVVGIWQSTRTKSTCLLFLAGASVPIGLVFYRNM